MMYQSYKPSPTVNMNPTIRLFILFLTLIYSVLFHFQIMEEHNENHNPMNLVLFDDALDHLTRIHRVIRMDQGHSLLVGVGGSGKQSLTKLAAFAAGCEIFEIMLSRGYTENSLRDDLKVLYNKLGMENKKVAFLFTDMHVVEEGERFMSNRD